MADDSSVWDHIADLHKKHSELAIQLHEQKGGNGDPEALKAHRDQLGSLEACVKDLTASIKELIGVMKQDVKTDKAVAGGRAKS